MNPIALPGAPGLDCDIADLTITSVVTTDDQEILIRLTGGHGQLNGDPVEVSNVHVDVRVQWPDMPPDLFAGFVARLQRWRDTAALLRMCAAPGRLSVLVDDDGALVPLPRRAHPDWITDGP